MKTLNIILIFVIIVSVTACTRVVDTGTPGLNEKSEINQNEATEYVSCVCCCSEDNPPEICLYRSKGEKIEDIIAKDKANTADCSTFGCTLPTKYIYCD
ncbi:MAG: hypothetical protein ABH830_01545 [Patescibacteria group bacterium]